MLGDNINTVYKYLKTFPYYFYGFFITIYNLIQPAENFNYDNHASDVTEFIECFERRYGPKRPRFLTTDYVSAINKSKSSLRFLLLYLHGDDHEDSDYFCRNTLCDDVFLDFLRQSDVLCWGCNINSVEGFRVSKIVREHSYPFVGIVAMGTNSRMYLVARSEGDVPAGRLVEFVAHAIQTNGTGVSICRAQREQREGGLDLRRQQEEDYAAWQRIERAQEAPWVEEAVEEDRQSQGGASVLLRLRFPSGAVRERQFAVSDPLRVLFAWILSTEGCPRDFSVFSDFPKREIECRQGSLRGAGFLASTLLYVVDNRD